MSSSDVLTKRAMSVVSSKKKFFFARLSLSSLIDTAIPPCSLILLCREGYTTTYSVSRQKNKKIISPDFSSRKGVMRRNSCSMICAPSTVILLRSVFWYNLIIALGTCEKRSPITMDPRGIISYGTTNNCGVCVPVRPFREIKLWINS